MYIETCVLAKRNQTLNTCLFEATLRTQVNVLIFHNSVYFKSRARLALFVLFVLLRMQPDGGLIPKQSISSEFHNEQIYCSARSFRQNGGKSICLHLLSTVWILFGLDHSVRWLFWSLFHFQLFSKKLSKSGIVWDTFCYYKGSMNRTLFVMSDFGAAHFVTVSAASFHLFNSIFFEFAAPSGKVRKFGNGTSKSRN